MEIFLDCLPCFLRQVLEASRMTTTSKKSQEKMMKDTIDIISEYNKYRNSPELGREIHKIVKKHTGIMDPYQKIKDKNIKKALEVYPTLKRFLYRQKDRLYWALKIAATGNIIDSAIYGDIDIEKSIKSELEKEFKLCDIDILQNKLKTAKNLLIIGDNAGETVFDRVLVEDLLSYNITYAVRSEAIINDATMEDACASGLDICTTLVSTGCNAPGLILDECNEKFMKIFNNSDIIISKGQGNYETLSDINKGIFFLLKAKCPVISNKLGVNVNDYIFKWVNNKDI